VTKRELEKKLNEQAVDLWNLKCAPGARVAVSLDDGSIWETTTRSVAWNLGDGTAVVLLSGKAGGYLLERVKPQHRAPRAAEPEDGWRQEREGAEGSRT
jgi:hypothetical protein